MKEGGGDAGQGGVQGKEAREEGGKYFRAIICIIRGNPLSCRQLIFRLMELQSIWTVARYEAKLLRRSWLFRVFGVLVVAGIAGMELYYFTGVLPGRGLWWTGVALGSHIPLYSLRLFTVAAAVMGVFVAAELTGARRKADTLDVVYARPVGNGEYMAGKVAGMLAAFGGLLAVAVAVVLFLHVAVARTPFSAAAYVLYAVGLALPAFVFTLGLALAVGNAVRERAVVLVAALGILAILGFYAGKAGYGVADLFGWHTPMVSSDVTGLADGTAFVLQRGMLLAAGAGLIFMAMARFRRLPNRAGRPAGLYAGGAAILALALAAGGAYIGHYRGMERGTERYAAVYDRYAGESRAHVAEQRLEVTLAGERLEGRSELAVVNPTGERMERVVLYLNPELEIEGLACEGQAVAFARDGQAVLVEQALEAGDTLRLEMAYSGGIDERVCYTDVPVKERREHAPYGKNFRAGKRYAWVTEDFVQLTPECLWYPTGTAAAHPALPFDVRRDFTRYALEVRHPEGLTVISQGKVQREPGRTAFTNGYALPCLSLTAGEYERMGIEVDSVLYELYYFPGHDGFMKDAAILRDTMASFIRDMNDDVVFYFPLGYPYRKFVLAETPVTFCTYMRPQKGYTEYVMPEVLFLPEQNYTVPNDLGTSARTVFATSNGQESHLTLDMIRAAKSYFFDLLDPFENQPPSTLLWSIRPLLLRHRLAMQPEEYPAMDLALQKMQGKLDFSIIGNNGKLGDEDRANLYLKEHSLEEAMRDRDIEAELLLAIVRQKSKELVQRISLHTGMKPLEAAVRDFFRQHTFEDVPFGTFCREMQERLGVDMEAIVREWQADKGCPTVVVKDAAVRRVTGQEQEWEQVSFKAYNPSDKDALLTVNIIHPGEGAPQAVLLPAGEAREYRYLTEPGAEYLEVNTNVSGNLPASISLDLYSSERMTTQDTSTGAFPIAPEALLPPAGTIIVDNEDEGFTINEGKQRHRLKDLFRKEEKEHYREFMAWQAPTEWSYSLMEFCYGDAILSGVFKAKGDGAASVTWEADIPEEGYYEFSVWNPSEIGKSMMFSDEKGQYHHPNRDQHYFVRYGEEEEKVVAQEMAEEPSGWMDLGHFLLPAGKVTVTLTDETNGLYVQADAIKFSRINMKDE